MPLSNILILEDDAQRIRIFKNKFINYNLHITDQSEQAIKNLKNHRYDLIYLDHDLDQRAFVDHNTTNNTGHYVATWLADNIEEVRAISEHLPLVFIHSHNFEAAERMRKILLKADYNVSCLPFWQIAGLEHRRDFVDSPLDSIRFNNKIHREISNMLLEDSPLQVNPNSIIDRLSVLVENYNSLLERVHAKTELLNEESSSSKV